MSKRLEDDTNSAEQWHVFGSQLTIAQKSLLRDGILDNVSGLRKVICITESGEHVSKSLIAYEDEYSHWHYCVVSWDKDCRGCSNSGLEALNSE